MLATASPFPQFFDADGDPLDNGSLYFGAANLNPETNPQQVYWDAAGAQPAAQPIKVMNGYPVRSGTPANVYTALDYSLTVKNRRGRIVTYSPSATSFSNDLALQSQIAAITTNFANVVNPALGAGLIGIDVTLNYLAGTIGAVLQDGMVNVMWFLSQAERLQVKSGGTAIDLTNRFTAARTFGGNRILYVPGGTWSVTSLSFIDNLGGIVGDGIDVTIIRARSAVTSLIDLAQTSDANPRAGTFRGLTLDGNGFAQFGMNIQFRHQISLKDLYVVNNLTTGIREKDTYLARHENVRCRVNPTGLHLVGSNHSSSFVGCTFDGNSVRQMLVESLGTALDGNSALAFTACDFEFGTGSSIGMDITCTDINFFGCYVGENIPAAIIVMRSGLCTIKGGTMFYGNTGNSYLVNPVGGRVLFDGAQVSGQASGSIAMLMGGGGTAGRVSWRDCQGNGIVGGSPVWAGDCLDYGPQGIVYATRLGKNWTGEGNNVTFSSTVTGNLQSFIVLTAPGPSPILGARTALINNSQWRDGELLSLILVYQASKSVNVFVSGSALGGLPTNSVQAGLPLTAGTPNTAIGLQFTANANAYTIIEVLMPSAAVTDSLVIHECFLVDSRGLNKGAGVWGNLLKQ